MTTESSPGRTSLPDLDALLESAVASGVVPHAVVVAADADGVFYEGSAGRYAASGSTRVVSADTTFRIMSMTKIVCTAAALQQWERGELDLDAPVESYLPDFAEVQVLSGLNDAGPVLVEPKTAATVRHLLTHTAGFGYWFWQPVLRDYERLTGIPNVTPGSMEAFRAPMLAHPGTRFVYGIATDWLGRVVEAVAGTTLDIVIRERITEPLGMPNTSFHRPDDREAAFVGVHVRRDDGRWANLGDTLGADPQWHSGGHGLFSTPRDFIRFQRALLRGGELDGIRILSSATVDAAFDDQLGGLSFPAHIRTADPQVSADLTVGPDHTWGFGLLLNRQDLPGRRRAGTGGWSGLLNTHFFVDRTSGFTAAIYSNCLPFVAPEAWQLYQDVERAVYASR